MEKRKYMDYELAYQGFKDVEKILKEEGILAVKEKFKGMCSYSCEDNNIYFYYEDYNVYIDVDKGIYIDADKDEIIKEEWYVHSIVEVVSYGGDFDTLDITNNNDIQYRLNGLLDWATTHDYSEEDYNAEKRSLEKVLELNGN